MGVFHYIYYIWQVFNFNKQILSTLFSRISNYFVKALVTSPHFALIHLQQNIPPQKVLFLNFKNISIFIHKIKFNIEYF